MVNDQYRCPSGEEGCRVISSMNDHHAPLTDWALSHLPKKSPNKILDIGCGGGMLIGKLAHLFPDAFLFGADISDESVFATLKNNLDLVSEGRLDVIEASVSDLPYDNGCFDLITAVETYFFWPDPVSDIRSATAKLSSGGTMMIASEAYPDPVFDEVNNRHSAEYGMRLLPNDTLRDIMFEAGLITEYFVLEENNWVVFVGRKG